jgi:hypothetical protein
MGGQCTPDALACPSPACQTCTAGTFLCEARPEGTRCDGDCGACLSGECLADGGYCPLCHTCHTATLTCEMIEDGASCGRECGTCQGGLCLASDSQCDRCHQCDATSFTCFPSNDGSGCGECGICLGGTCQVEESLCPEVCEVCDPALFACAPRPDGGPCGGECGICVGGVCQADNSDCDTDCQVCDAATFACLPRPDGTACGGGECGVCEGGACGWDDSRCGECEVCDPNSLTCVPGHNDELCRGDCGTCLEGRCVANNFICDECEVCDRSSFTCVTAPDGEDCGDCRTCQAGTCLTAPNGTACGGDCGVCLGGGCVGSTARCPEPACQRCDLASLTCVPANEGAYCPDGVPTGPARGGHCGTCQGGVCRPEEDHCPGLTAPPSLANCWRCDATSLMCVTEPDGKACDDECPGPICPVCQEGQCSCPDELDEHNPTGTTVPCFDVHPSGGRVGPLFCCDASPGSCETCFALRDASGQFVCVEHDAFGNCVRHKRECRVCHEPCCAGRRRDLATCQCEVS